MTYINTLGIPILIKKYNIKTNQEESVLIASIWNCLRFCIYKDKQHGLVHLPSSKVIVFGPMKRLKYIAQKLDDQEIMAFSLDKICINQKESIMKWINRELVK